MQALSTLEPILLGMFPAKGDAPGADPPTLPRPPRSERRLSSWEDGFPQRLYVYESPSSVDELERFYRAALPGGGWHFLEGKAGTEGREGSRGGAHAACENVATACNRPFSSCDHTIRV